VGSAGEDVNAIGEDIGRQTEAGEDVGGQAVAVNEAGNGGGDGSGLEVTRWRR